MTNTAYYTTEGGWYVQETPDRHTRFIAWNQGTYKAKELREPYMWRLVFRHEYDSEFESQMTILSNADHKLPLQDADRHACPRNWTAT